MANRLLRLVAFWGVAASRNKSIPAKLEGSVPVFVVMFKLNVTSKVPPGFTTGADGMAVKLMVAQADCTSKPARLSMTSNAVFFMIFAFAGESSKYLIKNSS